MPCTRSTVRQVFLATIASTAGKATVPPMGALPGYDDPPIRPDAPPASSSGVWGQGDVLACFNLLPPERVVALPDPPLFGRGAPRHTVLGSGHPSRDDVVEINPQASSQWDGFLHITHPAHGFYNGVAGDDHGMHHWAARGIAGRGVLA